MRTLAIFIGVAVLGVSAAVAAPSMSAAKPVADAGNYAGIAGGYAVTFFVSPGSRSVLNVSIPDTSLACAPGGGAVADTTFAIPKAALRRNGSFSAAGSQNGVAAGNPARFSYSFAGRFSRATKQHTATATGTFREDLRYTDSTGVHHTCTTNTKAWTAGRSGSIPTAKSLVRQGNYRGIAGGYALTFAAAPGRVNSISIPDTSLLCSPGGGAVADTTFTIPQVTVRPDGSFTAQTSRSGVEAGATATFAYRFSGSFQGLNAKGAGSAAGVFREDVTYTDSAGVHHTCTTNTKSWTATRTS